MDPGRTRLARKLLRCSLALLGAYAASLLLWWFAITPVYSHALSLPMTQLVRLGEGDQKIVQDVGPSGRAVQVEVKGYGDPKKFKLEEVVHANLPLFLALGTIGLFGVPWRSRLAFLAAGLLFLYGVHLFDVWLRIRLAICDPAIVGDIAEIAFTNQQAKTYDRIYSFLLFGRRFVPVALWLFGIVRFGVIRRLVS